MTNPRSFQTMYLRLAFAADTYVHRPVGYVAPWDQVAMTAAGNYARYMGPVPGEVVGAQLASTQGWDPIPNGSTQYLGIAQFLSDPLEAQRIPASTWWLAFGLRLANAGANFMWRGRCAIYVLDGRTGARRTTIAVFNVSSGFNGSTAESAFFSGLTPGLDGEVLTGDVLAFEIGMEVQNTTGAPLAPQAAAFADGTDYLNVLFQATTSPQSVLVSPVPLVRTLPYPMEQPNPTVTVEEARKLCVDAWPPGTFHEFGDPGPGQTRSPDAELMDWFGETFKRYFWDLLDIWQRELDPGRALLKLSDWRDLFQILANPQRREDLAALVIARLRELGSGSTVFAVSAILGVILGYRNPTQLEILSFTPSQLRSAVEYVSLFPSTAIPAAADFSGSLRILTPHLYDGGVVWGSGTWMALSFDIAAGKRIHARLTAPDGFQKTWSPVTQLHEVQLMLLYGVEMAGHPVHGNWQLEVYRDVGSPAVNLVGWTLYAPGAPRSLGVGPAVPLALGPPWPAQVPNVVRDAGLGRWKLWWGVYANPALLSGATAADFREARGALSRIRLAINRADLILTKAPIPGTVQALPGGCVPG